MYESGQMVFHPDENKRACMVVYDTADGDEYMWVRKPWEAAQMRVRVCDVVPLPL